MMQPRCVFSFYEKGGSYDKAQASGLSCTVYSLYPYQIKKRKDG